MSSLLLFPILLPLILPFKHVPLFRLKCRPALMVYRSSQFLLLLPPSFFLSLSLSPLLPDTDVRSLTVVSDRVMSHASILKACLINQLPYLVTEQTNFGPAENPLAVLINTDTHEYMSVCTVHTMKCCRMQTRSYTYK